MPRHDTMRFLFALSLIVFVLVGCAESTSNRHEEAVRGTTYENEHPMQGHPAVVRARLASTPDIVRFPLDNSDVLRIELFEGLVVNVDVTARELRHGGLTVYSGVESGNARTTVKLYVSGSGILGNIWNERSVYDLQPAPDGRVWILELDPSRIEFGELIAPRPAPPIPAPPDPDRPTRESLQILREHAEYVTRASDIPLLDPPVIDVMLVYPSNVEPVSTEAEEVAIDVNLALRYLAKIRIVHTLQVGRGSYCPTECAAAQCTNDELYCINQELYWLATDDGVASSREEKNADVVAMVVESSILNGTSWTLDIESAQDQEAERKHAFMVVNRTFATAVHTFAHELGHLLGLRHERTAYPSTSNSLCNFASMVRDASDTSVGCTIMHTSDGGNCTQRFRTYSAPAGAVIQVNPGRPPVLVGTMTDYPTLVYGKQCTVAGSQTNDGLFGYNYVHLTAPFVGGYYDD